MAAANRNTLKRYPKAREQDPRETGLPFATVVIATKDRKEVLRSALRSVLAQKGDVETVVADDGSSDGTPEMVAGEFPPVKLLRSVHSAGCIVQRNRGVAAASANHVVMVDDDCTFDSPTTVQEAVQDLSAQRVGAVAMPFVNVCQGGHVQKQAPSKDGVYVASSFIGCAHAVRRDIFLRLGGYWSPLVRYWEEPDFCFRLLDAGYVTRLGRSSPVLHHYVGLARSANRSRFFAARNPCMFAWHNVPWPYFPAHLLAVSARELRSYLHYGEFWATASGVLHGWGDGARHWSERMAAPADTYRLFRKIKKLEPLRLEEIEHTLPPIRWPAP